MNKNILKKAIDELYSDKPRLDYIKGLLETLYELTETPITIAGQIATPISTPTIYNINDKQLSADESVVLDALAKSKLEFVKQGSVVEQ